MTQATERKQRNELALSGGAQTVDLSPPAWPVASEKEVERMAEVVRSGKWSWFGPHERAFCEDYAAFIGTKHCAAMANGTVTLQCGLQAVGVTPGDEVIVPGLTWVATAQAALDVGANVVLVDIDPETLCLDPAAFEAAITPRTKAVIPVHLYGCMCDMDAIMSIAKKHGIKVVEDVAHQQGSRWRDQGAGAIGDVGSYSFQQSKVLASGEGGAVTCDDSEIYETLFSLKQVGWQSDLSTPGNRYGHNYRITEMQCVLLRGGLERLPAQTARREESVARIATGLAEMGGPLRAVRRDPRVTRQAHYAMTLFFDPDLAEGITRNQYIAALKAEGCPAGSSSYHPVYRSPLLNLYHSTSPVPFRNPDDVQDYASLRLPVTERAVADTAMIIMQTHLLGTDAYIDQILAAIEKVNGNMDGVRSHFAG
ncbi:MAG: DegT/DnrJ/EryC1/StrS family aminotransferase [Lentisphaeria bacterium]|nr:DegT/DnrJ/EryC1/StrS family aminotransferase [Lentisphaeria bacterium]